MKDRVLIKNGSILDGSGNAAYNNDILIIGDKIEKIGKLDYVSDAYIIECDGKTVTPGFIDIHRHCDYALFKSGFGEIELAQGITTAITGSCGLTPFPLNKEHEAGLNNLLEPCLGSRPENVDFSSYESFDSAVRCIALPINIGSLIGSCTVRIAVKGFEHTAFSANELSLAKSHIHKAMEAGAFGISMGIMYTPEFYSTRDELTSLARVIAPYNGVLTCHIRGEGDSLVRSVEEITAIALDSGVKLEISHFKACGTNNWGKSIYEAIDIIEKAKSDGHDIGVDFYPYTGGSTTLLSLIPPAFMKESLSATWSFMATSEGVAALQEGLNQHYENWDNYVKSLGWERIIISSVGKDENKKLVGKSISEIIAAYGYSSECDFVCKVLSEEQGKVGIIVMSMVQNDVDTISRLPYSSVISDSLYSDGSNPHPRLYGSFGKIIRDLVLGRNILTLSTAIKKMTYMPAKVIGINDRGLLKEGYKADINIFEPANITDGSNFENPKVLCTGMDFVIVNGEIVLKNGKIVCNNAGKRLSKGE